MLRYMDLFLAESREHLGAAFELQDRLESEPSDTELWRELLRHAHSLKGMAAAMSYGSMVILAHAMEDLLQGLQEFAPPTASAHFTLLTESLECLEHIVDRVERGENTESTRAEQLAGELQQHLRDLGHAARDPIPTDPIVALERDASAVPTERREPASDIPPCWRIELLLDRDAGLSAERTVAILRDVARLGQVVQASPPLSALDTGRFEGRLRLWLRSRMRRSDLERVLRSVGGVRDFTLDDESATTHEETPVQPARWMRVKAERLDELVERVLELKLEQGLLRAGWPEIPDLARQHLERSEFQMKEIHGILMELRLVPFDSVAHRLRQSVTQLARELDKSVRFEILGGQVPLDRFALDGLVDPLLHIVRNSMDHGIESPRERRSLGKTEHGSLRLLLDRRGDRIRILIRDDGRGIRIDEVKRTAVARGLIDATVLEGLSDSEVLMLTTLPELSTARRISHTSGRGVGLDVVRSAVERLGGRMEIRSEPGSGTEMRISVPHHLALIQALMVRCGGELYAVPIDRVERTLKLIEPYVAGDRTAGTIHTDDGPLPMTRLDRLLGIPAAAERDSGETWGLVLSVGERRSALVVDEILGRREIAVKPFQAPLNRMAQYAGAALLEDGTITIVLDPHGLTRLAARQLTDA